MPLLALLLLFTFGLPKLGFIYSLFTSTVVVLGLYGWPGSARSGAGQVSIPDSRDWADRSRTRNGMRFDQI